MTEESLHSRIYLALATAETETPGMLDWLLEHGHAELAQCPTCRRADFRHKARCPMGEAMELLRTLERRAFRARHAARHRPRTAVPAVTD